MEAVLSELHRRFEKQECLPEPPKTDEQALRDYLEKTGDVGLDAVGRLISLAVYYSDKLSWAQICDIFERALLECDNQTGTFAVWTTTAEDLLSAGKRSESERNQIAQDLVKILDRALLDNPENCSYALGMGLHYFREAMHQSDASRKSEFIEQARVWLNRVIGWAGEDDAQCCAYAVLYLGHCHTALEEFQRALMRYNGVSIELLTNDEREIQGLAEGISICKRALEMN